jgi:hypothetical protein
MSDSPDFCHPMTSLGIGVSVDVLHLVPEETGSAHGEKH